MVHWVSRTLAPHPGFAGGLFQSSWTFPKGHGRGGGADLHLGYWIYQNVVKKSSTAVPSSKFLHNFLRSLFPDLFILFFICLPLFCLSIYFLHTFISHDFPFPIHIFWDFSHIFSHMPCFSAGGRWPAVAGPRLRPRAALSAGAAAGGYG